MMNTSLHRIRLLLVGRVGGVSKLDALSLIVRLSPGGWWASAAYHSLHLLSELLVQQCIYKRVDRGVKQDHRVTNDKRYFTNIVGCELQHNVNNCVCAPTYCKDGTDSYDHQGDSFPHPKDTLWNWNGKQSIKLSDKTSYLKIIYAKKVLNIQWK